MLLQQRDNLLPGLLTTLLTALLSTLLPALPATSGFCLRVFGCSPTFNRFPGGEEQCNTSVQQRSGG